MQFQADILGVPVIRPKVAETTALGAAYAAGLATGFWGNDEDLRENWVEDKRWEPRMDAASARALPVLEEGRRRAPSTGRNPRANVARGGDGAATPPRRASSRSVDST